jgi:hypothetical protein
MQTRNQRLHQYLYSCTSSCVSICTFALADLVARLKEIFQCPFRSTSQARGTEHLQHFLKDLEVPGAVAAVLQVLQGLQGLQVWAAALVTEHLNHFVKHLKVPGALAAVLPVRLLLKLVVLKYYKPSNEWY